MASEEKYIVSLRKHIFTAPHPAVSITVFLITILIFSYLLHPKIWGVISLFLIPYLLVIVLDYYTIKILRIYFPLQRISTLNLFVFIIGFIQFWLFDFLFGFKTGFFLSFASVIYPRFVIYRTFLSERKYSSLLVSSYYSIMIFVMALVYMRIYNFPWLQYIIASLIYLAVGYIMIRTTTAPFRREFKEDPLFFISSFLNYMGRLGYEDRERLDKFFYGIYQNRKVPISAMTFKAGDRIKAVFLAPYIHPGPFGEVGGSNIPNKIAKILNMDNLMVFHTTTTHDNNIANEEDVQKIAMVVKHLISGGCEYSEMSDMYRVKVGGHHALIQAFGDYAFVGLVPENCEFDDVELNTGLMIMESINRWFRGVMAIDAHNNFNENSLPLSLLGSDLNELKKLAPDLKKNSEIRMGFASRKCPGHSIGPGGIRGAVFNYNGKKIAYLLIDGNNIKKGLRDRIRTEISNIDELEVFSTDNHVVNTTVMDMNPIGTEDSWDEIISVCKEVVNDAIGNIEKVCVNMKTNWVELRMASRGQLERITSITKESVKVAKIAVPVLSISAFLVSFVVFFIS